MSYLKLSKKALQGKLLQFANFEDGSFINLIEIDKPYKDGSKFTVYETTKSAFCSNGIFKTIEDAQKKFDLMVRNGSYESKLKEKGIVDHTKPFPNCTTITKH
jgi:hypothetical protein